MGRAYKKRRRRKKRRITGSRQEEKKNEKEQKDWWAATCCRIDVSWIAGVVKSTSFPQVCRVPSYNIVSCTF